MGVRVSKSLRMAVLALTAALYAVGAYATGWITSPWGRGQFRPAVVIPAAFALIDPLAAAAGSALGTFIADSWKHGSPYLPSLLAAVPGNFVGFYLFGLILARRRTWGGFLAASLLSMAVGNFIVAFLYVPVIQLLGMIPPQPPAALALLAAGLWAWFFATEYPFLVAVLPPIAKALGAALPSLTYFKPGPLTRGEARRLAAHQLAAAAILAALAATLAFTPASQSLAWGLSVKLGPQASVSAVAATGAMLFASSLVLAGSTALTLRLAPRASGGE